MQVDSFDPHYHYYAIICKQLLGLLDDAQNRWDEAREEAGEALKIYRELAQKEPETYLPQVAITLNNLGFVIATRNS